MTSVNRVGLCIALSILAVAADAPGQPPRKVIGQLHAVREPTPEEIAKSPFNLALKELGWTEGQNLVVERRYASDKHDRLSELAAELVRRKVNVIVTSGTPATIAAKNATKTIPIVFSPMGDPLEKGVITSLAKPGGNVTGVALLSAVREPKKIQLLRELLPRARRIAWLYDPATRPGPWLTEVLREMENSARSVGVKLHAVPVRASSELEGAINSVAQAHDDAVSVGPEDVFALNRERVLALIARHRLPAVYAYPRWVSAGGLMSFGEDGDTNARDAARLVDRILRGASPAELPVQQASRFLLTMNGRTAKALGITIPPALAVRVDRVIDP